MRTYKCMYEPDSTLPILPAFSLAEYKPWKLPKNVCHSQKHTLISCWLRACCHSNGLLGCLVFSRLIGEQRKQLTRLYYNHRVTMAWWIVFWTLGWGGVQPLLGVGRDDMICVVFLVFRVLGQLLKVNVKWWWASGLPTAYVQYDIGLA